MNIKELRSEIDLIDKELKTLFIKRMAVVSRVIEYKKLHDMNVYDPKREQEMFEGLSSERELILKCGLRRSTAFLHSSTLVL